jgi:hypothetical protein
LATRVNRSNKFICKAVDDEGTETLGRDTKLLCGTTVKALAAANKSAVNPNRTILKEGRTDGYGS